MSQCRDDFEGTNSNLRLSRRGLMQTAVGTGLGLSLAGSLKVKAEDNSDLRARARKNLKLGIMSSVYADLPVDKAARQIKADGFSCVVSDFSFADVHFNPLEPDWAAARKIVSTLERAGIEIVSLFGYYNVVDPDLKKRKLGEARIEALLSSGNRLGYAACARRGWKPFEIEDYRIPLRERLPAIPIPLRRDDRDVALDLQSLIDQCYEFGRYGDDIDYREEPEPPLPAEDAGWANALLREQGLRG